MGVLGNFNDGLIDTSYWCNDYNSTAYDQNNRKQPDINYTIGNVTSNMYIYIPRPYDCSDEKFTFSYVSAPPLPSSVTFTTDVDVNV